MKINNRFCILMLMALLINLECSYGQISSVLEDFDSYRIHSTVEDTVTKINQKRAIDKFIDDLILLDTLLSLGKIQEVRLMKGFNFFESIRLENDSTYHLILSKEKSTYYDDLVNRNMIDYLVKLDRDGKLIRIYASLSFLQIAILPDIRSILRDDNYERNVSKVYLNAIENRISRTSELNTKGFNLNSYLSMEKRYFVNTYSKMISYRANFLNFLFHKYKIQ